MGSGGEDSEHLPIRHVYESLWLSQREREQTSSAGGGGRSVVEVEWLGAEVDQQQSILVRERRLNKLD
jgi:hypothetical protein